jgi:hypothetical protein
VFKEIRNIGAFLHATNFNFPKNFTLRFQMVKKCLQFVSSCRTSARLLLCFFSVFLFFFNSRFCRLKSLLSVMVAPYDLVSLVKCFIHYNRRELQHFPMRETHRCLCYLSLHCCFTNKKVTLFFDGKRPENFVCVSGAAEHQAGEQDGLDGVQQVERAPADLQARAGGGRARAQRGAPVGLPRGLCRHGLGLCQGKNRSTFI